MRSWFKKLFTGASKEKKSDCSGLRGHKETEGETELTFWFMDYTMSVFGFALRSVVFDGNSKDGDYARRSYLARWNRLLTETMMRDRPEKRQGHYRVLKALRESIVTGAFVLENEDDVKMLDKLIHADFSFCPELVENYVRSGELVDALRLLMPRDLLDYRLPNDPGGDQMMTVTRVLRVCMFRLYYYDTMRVREINASRGVIGYEDDGELEQLPLEIRLHFSGFFDPAMFDEPHWDIRVRQQRLSSDTAFDLYENLLRTGNTRDNVLSSAVSIADSGGDT